MGFLGTTGFYSESQGTNGDVGGRGQHDLAAELRTDCREGKGESG